MGEVDEVGGVRWVRWVRWARWVRSARWVRWVRWDMHKLAYQGDDKVKISLGISLASGSQSVIAIP